MSAPMTDLHLSHVIRLGLKTIRSNPKKYVSDIFGEANLPPHAKIYGQKTVEQAIKWISETEIPVILGFDLTEAKLPAVTVHLSSSTPIQSYVGDYAIGESEPLGFQDKEVLVPAFQPEGLALLGPTSAKLTLPKDMALDLKELFLPGLMLRDAKNREYGISTDDDGNVVIEQVSPDAPVSEIDPTRLEVVSPVLEGTYTRGAMLYKETATIVVHGNANRQEGLWLYYFIMWTLLKFRPVLTGLLGLDLTMPMASDYSRDDSFLGENVWRRYISVESTTTWNWEQARQKDILGLALSYQVVPGSGT